MKSLSEEFFPVHVFITIMLLVIIILACNKYDGLSDKVDILVDKVEVLEYKLELQGG